MGQLLVNQALPAPLRQYDRVLDAPGLQKLFQTIADTQPAQYRTIVKQLSDIGRYVAYRGGISFDLSDIHGSQAADRFHTRVQQALNQLRQSPLSQPEREQALVKLLNGQQKQLEDVIYDEAVARGNPLALHIKAGSRGKKMNLKSLLAGDILYEDHHGNPIPIPVLSSFSKGLRPVEYYAGSFGARKGVADTKLATQDAGFFGKQLTQAAHDLVVTATDYDDDDDRSHLGLPVPTTDSDSVGALLSRPVGTYPRHTVLTPKILRDLQDQGVKQILIRSPLVGGPRFGGVFSRDVGVREKERLAPLGDFVGHAAAQAIGEKLSQGQLNSKHTGGVSGEGAATTGFKFINQLVQSPKTFNYGATHAQKDGTVSGIRNAPQGGNYVKIEDEEHYVPADLELKVKPGDVVEAGDVLSSGVPVPAEVVKHKGIGEGRRYFTQAFLDAFRRSGMGAHRRNVELVATGLVNHVRLTQEHGDYVPGDVLRYSDFAADYTPRTGARSLAPREALGQYLERPVLHYSIGTKVRPSMLPLLQEFGIHNLHVHTAEPVFEPEYIRGIAMLQHHPDWLTRHLGSGLEKSTLHAVHRGEISNTAGASFVPAAVERLQFGRHGLTRSYQPVRDGDNDGKIYDGTAREQVARKSASLLDGLLT
jgi:DNA-directed RNA polymerase subunit beta'